MASMQVHRIRSALVEFSVWMGVAVTVLKLEDILAADSFSP